MKTMTDLKDVFSGISSFMYSSSAISSNAETINFAPELELPVTVDTLSLSQDEPTINHYKVHGLGTDWVSTSEPGDATISFTVPSVDDDVLKLAYGNAAIASSVSLTIAQSVGSGAAKSAVGNYSGNGATFSNTKIQGSIALLNDAGNKLLIVNNIALYASPVFDNASTEPFAFRFSGTIESGSASNMYFLTKTA